MVKKKSNKNNAQENEVLETDIIETKTIIKDKLIVEDIQEKSFEVIKFNINEIINNEIIKEIQQGLKNLGYNISILGNYDNMTYGAVCDYKRKKKYKEINGDITEKLYKDIIKVRE